MIFQRGLLADANAPGTKELTLRVGRAGVHDSDLDVPVDGTDWGITSYNTTTTGNVTVTVPAETTSLNVTKGGVTQFTVDFSASNDVLTTFYEDRSSTSDPFNSYGVVDVDAHVSGDFYLANHQPTNDLRFVIDAGGDEVDAVISPGDLTKFNHALGTFTFTVYKPDGGGGWTLIYDSGIGLTSDVRVFTVADTEPPTSSDVRNPWILTFI